MTKPVNTEPSQQVSSRIRWQGQIESVQCRAWVWRYKTDNRTHHHLGFNLFVKGEADGREGRFIVAVSDTQHTKLVRGSTLDIWRASDFNCRSS